MRTAGLIDRALSPQVTLQETECWTGRGRVKPGWGATLPRRGRSCRRISTTSGAMPAFAFRANRCCDRGLLAEAAGGARSRAGDALDDRSVGCVWTHHDGVAISRLWALLVPSRRRPLGGEPGAGLPASRAMVRPDAPYEEVEHPAAPDQSVDQVAGRLAGDALDDRSVGCVWTHHDGVAISRLWALLAPRVVGHWAASPEPACPLRGQWCVQTHPTRRKSIRLRRINPSTKLPGAGGR